MKLLLAVDGSEYSVGTVKAVASRPWPTGTIIRVISVVKPVTLLTPEMAVYSSVGLENEHEKAVENANESTSRMGDWVRSRGLLSEAAVRSGDPRSSILDEAHEWDADLIVVGSHSDSGVKRWLLGTVAQSVVSHAGCSVEVVRQKASTKQAKKRGKAEVISLVS